MPSADINGASIHYLLSGEGDETVLFLNGIMMSTASWAQFVPVYTNRGFQVLRMDFRDQGQSSKHPVEYDISQHAEDIKGLLDYLNIKKANIIGISYGGQAAMLFALKYPHMIERLILANTTAKFGNYIRAVGRAWDEAASLRDGAKFLRLAMPLIYSDKFYEENSQLLREREEIFGKALDNEWFEGYLRLSSSHGNFDIREDINAINMPVLLIASDKDIITPLSDMMEIHNSIKDSKMVVLPQCGHASFFEKMDEFNIQILGFLSLVRR